MVYIDLVKCTGHDYCRSEEEFKSFLDGQYLALLSNQIRFDFEQYGLDSIIQESQVEAIKLGTWHSRQLFEIS